MKIDSNWIQTKVSFFFNILVGKCIESDVEIPFCGFVIRGPMMRWPYSVVHRQGEVSTCTNCAFVQFCISAFVHLCSFAHKTEYHFWIDRNIKFNISPLDYEFHRN